MSTVIVLVAVFWFLPEPTPEQSLPPLTSLDPQTVDRIHLSNNNGPGFELRRIAGEWYMLAPYKVAANTPRIEILLDLVSTPSLEHFDLPKDDLQQFGLDKPLATIEFNNIKLTVGGTHPYNYRRYIQRGGQLHLTNDVFPHHLLALAEDFISHALFSPDEHIVGIKSDQWEIKQNSQKEWRFISGSTGLSSEQLGNKVEEWNHSWAKKVISIPDDKETQEFEVSLSGTSTPLLIEMVSQKKELVLIRRDRGVAYRLPAATVFHLPKNR